MRLQPYTQVGFLILLVVAFATVNIYGQADSEWLKSWNDAQTSRTAKLASRGRIAPEEEPGTPLVIHGEIRNPDGTPANAVVVHAYHRDTEGLDFGPNDSTLTTWRLQGWLLTDTKGQFEFHSIRPAPDHLNREGAHIHFTVESADFGRQWAPTVFLSDDQRVTKDQHRRSHEAGEFGWVQEVSITEGVQHIKVKFKLKETADF